jgi:hypothetical protein
MGSRQDGLLSRLSEGNRKTIAFFWRWSFFISMIKSPASRFVLLFLALCILMSGQTVYVLDIETSETGFDETDGEDDLLMGVFLASIFSGLISLKMGMNHLEFQAVCLAPLAPPPKPA